MRLTTRRADRMTTFPAQALALFFFAFCTPYCTYSAERISCNVYDYLLVTVTLYLFVLLYIILCRSLYISVCLYTSGIPTSQTRPLILILIK